MRPTVSPRDEGRIVTSAPLAPGEDFVYVPKALLLHPGLSDGAEVLYCALLDYASKEGSRFPGQARLAEDLRVSERTIRQRLRELEAAGFLRVKQGHHGKTSVYQLLCSPGEAEVGEGKAELDGPATQG